MPDANRDAEVPAWSPRRRILVGVLIGLGVIMLLPESPTVPVQGATDRDWNRASFWYGPWGRSGVHKGIDIFAPQGTPVVAPTYGLVIFRGEIPVGGRVIVMLGPKLRLHYFAHLQAAHVYPGHAVLRGRDLGDVGDTGNARGKPPHLHYAVLTIVPYLWRIDDSTQGWKKAFYLDPFDVLDVH